MVALLPVGLGAKGGEFNKVYFDTFQRIVLRGEPCKTVLDAAGRDDARDHDRDQGAVLGAGQAERRPLPGQVDRRVTSAPPP